MARRLVCGHAGCENDTDLDAAVPDHRQDFWQKYYVDPDNSEIKKVEARK